MSGLRGRRKTGVDLTEPTLSNQIGEERQWWWVVVGGLQVRVTIKNPLQYINSQNYRAALAVYRLQFVLFIIQDERKGAA